MEAWLLQRRWPPWSCCWRHATRELRSVLPHCAPPVSPKHKTLQSQRQHGDLIFPDGQSWLFLSIYPSLACKLLFPGGGVVWRETSSGVHGTGGCYLLVLRQGRHDAEEGCIVLIDGEDGVGVGRVDAGARQVRARDAMAWCLQEAPELEPAPGSMAGAMHQHEVMPFRHLLHSLLLPS